MKIKLVKPVNMTVGFYITAASALIAIITAICYGALFSGISYKEPVFSVTICILLAVAAAAAVALLLLGGKRFAGFAPAVLCLCAGISFMIFVTTVVWPIADTAVGIEPFPQMTQLIICAVLLFVNFVASEVALYMKKYKSAAERKEEA